MKLVLDVVINHTSERARLVRRVALVGRRPKRGWYWWRPPDPGSTPARPGAEPTNWTSFFSGPTWTLDPATGEYYLHLFAPSSPTSTGSTARSATPPTR